MCRSVFFLLSDALHRWKVFGAQVHRAGVFIRRDLFVDLLAEHDLMATATAAHKHDRHYDEHGKPSHHFERAWRCFLAH